MKTFKNQPHFTLPFVLSDSRMSLCNSGAFFIMHNGQFKKGHKNTVGEKNAMFGTKRPQYVCDAIAKANRDRKWTEERRANHGSWAKGEKNEMWRGGVRLRGNKYIKGSFRWRRLVVIKCNNTCQKCGIQEKKMFADHIKPYSLYPDLRFDVDNGQILCKECNKTKTSEDMKIIRIHYKNNPI